MVPLESVLAAVMPGTPGEWVAFVGAGLLDGLVSPFTWAALLLGGLLAWSCQLIDRPPRDTRLRRSGCPHRLGWWRAATDREERR